MYVYVVEGRMDYEEGCAEGVFSTEKNARKFIESKNGFAGWDVPKEERIEDIQSKKKWF